MNVVLMVTAGVRITFYSNNLNGSFAYTHTNMSCCAVGLSVIQIYSSVAYTVLFSTAITPINDSCKVLLVDMEAECEPGSVHSLA